MPGLSWELNVFSLGMVAKHPHAMFYMLLGDLPQLVRLAETMLEADALPAVKDHFCVL